MQGALGRRTPKDWSHVSKFPYSIQATTPETVEKTLRLPRWHQTHDQGAEGSCVGHGVSMERSITNTGQNRLANILKPGVRYDPIWLWNEAKMIDYWPETNPGDDNGTSVSAAYDVLRTRGHRRIKRAYTTPDDKVIVEGAESESVDHGIIVNRWATNVDEMRHAINGGTPVSIGVTWWSNFDTPEFVRRLDGKDEYWIGRGDLGTVRGGHCVCIFGASDQRQAFRVKNSWGKNYPLTWLPYVTMQTLLDDYGEAALVTDR